MVRNLLIPRFLHSIANFIIKLKFKKVYPITLAQKFKELGISQDPRLERLLFSSLRTFDISKDDCPFYKAWMIPYFANNGICYPKDGPVSIVETVVSTIE